MNSPIDTRIDIRDENITSLSMEEIMKQREMELNDFDYETESLPSSTFNLQQSEKRYNHIDDYIKDNDLHSIPEKDNILYILELNNEKIKINPTGMLECNPPILTFANQHCDSSLPIDSNIYNADIDILPIPLIFKVFIKDKEFKYHFDKVTEFNSTTNYDERYTELQSFVPDSSKFHNETAFIKFTISDDSHKNMHTDDIYRSLIFAKYDDKIIFRQGKFRMIRDEMYNEMENMKWNF